MPATALHQYAKSYCDLIGVETVAAEQAQTKGVGVRAVHSQGGLEESQIVTFPGPSFIPESNLDHIGITSDGKARLRENDLAVLVPKGGDCPGNSLSRRRTGTELRSMP